MGPGGSGWGATVTAMLVALKTLGGGKPLKNQSHHIYTFFSSAGIYLGISPGNSARNCALFGMGSEKVTRTQRYCYRDL